MVYERSESFVDINLKAEKSFIRYITKSFKKYLRNSKVTYTFE